MITNFFFTEKRRIGERARVINLKGVTGYVR